MGWIKLKHDKTFMEVFDWTLHDYKMTFGWNLLFFSIFIVLNVLYWWIDEGRWPQVGAGTISWALFESWVILWPVSAGTHRMHTYPSSNTKEDWMWYWTGWALCECALEALPIAQMFGFAFRFPLILGMILIVGLFSEIATHDPTEVHYKD